MNQETELNPSSRFFIIFSVMLSTIMQALDTTIANVALPHMQGTMGASQDQISWVLTSYIVASAIFMPLTGFLTARYGRRQILIISVTGFTLASMACGAAQSLNQIVLFRLLQGIFGASLIPLAQAVMLDIFPREKQGSAMATFGIGVMLGPILGPSLGGVLTEYYNWRWVFYINVPLGMIALFGLIRFVPETGLDKNRRFDLLGFSFLAIGIGSLQMMLDRGSSLNWFASGEVVIECLLALLAFYLFIAHIFTHKSPFIEPALFKDRNLSAGLMFIFVVGVVLLASMALLPPFMQNLMGYPVIDTGYLLAPRGLGTMAAMMIVGRLTTRVDARYLILIGLLAISGSLWQMTHFTTNTSGADLVQTGVLQGFGFGFVFVPLSTVTFATLAPRYRTEGTSMYSLIRNIGSSIGISVVTTFLAQSIQRNHAAFSSLISPENHALTDAVNQGILSPTPTGLSLLDGMVNGQAVTLAYLQDFRLMMFVTLAAIPFLLFMQSPHKVRKPTTARA
ncbi:MAG: MDR family MFS transporter [Reinekea sp.]